MAKLKQKEINTITKITTSDDGGKTFSFMKELEGVKGKHAIFILLYPTRNEENCTTEDTTNIHILNHISELDISSYTVINLFAKVTQSRLSTKGLCVDEENMEFIRKNIFNTAGDKDTVVIVAWGNSNITSKTVNESKKRLLEIWIEMYPELQIYQLTANGLAKETMGVHPLFLGIRYSNSIWKLSVYPTKKALKELAERGSKKSKKEQGLSREKR
jgi:hypothetical protein